MRFGNFDIYFDFVAGVKHREGLEEGREVKGGSPDGDADDEQALNFLREPLLEEN